MGSSRWSNNDNLLAMGLNIVLPPRGGGGGVIFTIIVGCWGSRLVGGGGEKRRLCLQGACDTQLSVFPASRVPGAAGSYPTFWQV